MPKKRHERYRLLTSSEAFFYRTIEASKREVQAMDPTTIYPKNCRKNINRIVNAIGASVETTYAMMLMTAMLMDLRPEDDAVADMILEDCGISPECA
jgi:hypothetical protein